MTRAWWEITTAAAFGQFTLAWHVAREHGTKILTVLGAAPPGLALLVQAVVLYVAGTSLGGTAVSFLAGFAALLAAMWLQRKWHRHLDKGVGL